MTDPTKLGFLIGSIPAEESDEEFARQIEEMDSPVNKALEPLRRFLKDNLWVGPPEARHVAQTAMVLLVTALLGYHKEH